MEYPSTTDDIWIEDERLTDLLRFLPYIKTARAPDGWMRVEAAAPPDDAAPFFRAWRRLEGQLLIDDGEQLIDDPWGPVRTTDERAADAFLELVRTIRTAAEESRR